MSVAFVPQARFLPSCLWRESWCWKTNLSCRGRGLGCSSTSLHRNGPWIWGWKWCSPRGPTTLQVRSRWWRQHQHHCGMLRGRAESAGEHTTPPHGVQLLMANAGEGLGEEKPCQWPWATALDAMLQSLTYLFLLYYILLLVSIQDDKSDARVVGRDAAWCFRAWIGNFVSLGLFPSLSSEEFMLGLICNNYGLLFIWQALCYELSMPFFSPYYNLQRWVRWLFSFYRCINWNFAKLRNFFNNIQLFFRRWRRVDRGARQYVFPATFCAEINPYFSQWAVWTSLQKVGSHRGGAPGLLQCLNQERLFSSTSLLKYK